MGQGCFILPTQSLTPCPVVHITGTHLVSESQLFFFLTDQLYKLWAAYCSKCLRERHLPRQQIYQNIPFFLAPMAISQTWFHVLFCVAHCWCCYICYTCVTSPKSYCTCYQHRTFKMYICLIMSLSDLKSFLLAYYSWN